jgi:hypothetical protein
VKSEIIRSLTAALVGLALFAPHALAQETPPANDPGNWRPSEPTPPNLDSEGNPAPANPAPENPEVLPPGLPPAGGEGAAPAPTPGERRELTEEEQAQVARNRQKAIDILDTTLNDNVSDYRTIESRVKNLERLIKDNEANYNSALSRRQRLQVELMQRTLLLKGQFDQGKLTQDIYQKRLAEENQQYVSDKKRLDADVKFYGEELARLRPQLQEQKTRMEVMKQSRPELATALKPKPRPELELPNQVNQTLRKLVDFRVRASLGNERIDGSVRAGSAAPVSSD